MQIPHKPMSTQNTDRTELRRRLHAIGDAALALANGKDPADFPEYGFDPGVERLAEILGGGKLRAVTLRLNDPVCWPALALYAKDLESHDPDEAAKIQAGLAEARS